MTSFPVLWSIVPVLRSVGFSPLKNEAQPCDVVFLVLVMLRLSPAERWTLGCQSVRDPWALVC